ncbi:MAG: hypothetical protein CL867_11390 [Cytophagaceae bacterium]|nr:hypothetical protein [Cytophagaceae bacterium]|tara:strand:- start:832 stop:1071 length:240 start_codon:yes stop_codon:yes gene_type:complete
MEDEKIFYAMDLAESLCTKIYSSLTEEEKKNDALIVALIWVAVAVGLKSELSATTLKMVVQFATDSALEELEAQENSFH